MLAGAVNIKFMADIMDLQAKMTQAQTSVAGAMGNIEKAVNQAKTALGALGMGLSVGAFAEMIKGSIEAMDSLNDLSKTTGISVVQLAGLKLAAKQSGSDLESLAKSINKLSVNSAKDAERFEKLGITAKDPLEKFKQLADIFSAIESPQLRATMAAEALGKSWEGAAPALSEGGKRLQEMIDKGSKLSGITQEMASRADEFNDKMAELEAASNGAKMKLADEMAPAMTAIATAFGDAYQEGGKLHALWVALGGLGAFMFTDEFKTTAAKIRDANAELLVLKETLKSQQQTPQFGMLHRWLYGENYAQENVDAMIKKIKDLQAILDKPAADAAAKAADAKARAADAKATADATARAAAFIKNEADKAAAILKTQDAFIHGVTKEYETLTLGNAVAKEHEAVLLGITGKKLEDVKATLASIDAYKSATKTSQERIDLRKKEAEGIDAFMQKQTEDYNAAVKGSQDALAAAQAEYDQFGMTKSQIAEITLLTLQSTQAKFNDGTEGYNAAQKQIDAQKRLIEVLKKTETRDAGIKGAEDVAKEWQKGWEETDRIAREAFTGWAENGKTMAETIGTALKKAMLSAIYEATIKPIAFSIYSSIAGAPAGANALNQAGSAAGIYNAGSALGFVGAGTSAFAAGSTLASAGMGTEAFSAGLTMMTEATGASSFMAGAGQALGAIGPVGWAALAAIAVLSLQDHGTPTQNTGNASASFNATGTRTAYDTYFGGSSANTDAMIGNMQLAYMAGVKSLGIGTVATNFNYGTNTGKDSQNPQFALGGSAGSVYFYQGETTYSDAAVSLAASRAVFAALQGSDLPQYLAKVFNSATVGTMTQDQITNTLAFASSLKQVRDALLETREPLQILKDNVASGFAELQTSASSFKTDFVAAIDAGITPANLAAWQALGTNMEQLAQATGTADTAVKELGRSLSDIASERARLQDQYDTLTMTSAELLDKQRNALDSSNQALFDQVQAAQATKTAAESAAQAQLDAAAATQQLADAAVQAAAQLAATNKTWQDQLDVLTGAQTDRGIALRDAGDETTRALMRQVYAQQDLAAAAADLQSASVAATQAQKDFQTAIEATIASAATATNTALSNVATAIAAQRTIKEAAVSAAQAQVDAITSVFDALQSNIKALAPTSAAAGNAWLDAAIRSGGTSDQKGLADAMAAARGGLANNNFSSAVDAARANQLLVNKLSALSDLTDGKLSGAQAQLTAAQDAVALLDAQLKTAQDAVSASRENALTIVGALDKLQIAMAQEFATLATSFGNSMVSGFSAIDTSGNSQISLDEFKAQFAGLASDTTLTNVFNALDTDGSGLLSRLEAIKGSSLTSAQALTTMTINAAGGLMGGARTYTMQEAVDALKAAMATGASAGAVVNAANTNYGISAADVAMVATVTGNADVVAAANAAQTIIHSTGGALGAAQDWTMAQAEAAITNSMSQGYDVATVIKGAWQNWGISEADVRAAGRAAGIPGFARGTNWVPQDMLAQIHQGEAIIPAPFNPAKYGRDSGNDALVTEIKALREEVKSLRETSERGNENTQRSADTLAGRQGVPFLVEIAK